MLAKVAPDDMVRYLIDESQSHQFYNIAVLASAMTLDLEHG